MRCYTLDEHFWQNLMIERGVNHRGALQMEPPLSRDCVKIHGLSLAWAPALPAAILQKIPRNPCHLGLMHLNKVP